MKSVMRNSSNTLHRLGNNNGDDDTPEQQHSWFTILEKSVWLFVWAGFWVSVIYYFFLKQH